MTDALELALDERLPLRFGKRAHRDHEAIEVVALLGDLARVGVGGERLVELVDAGLPADRVEGAVADDREQPRAQVDLAGVGEEGGVGLGQRGLDDVLGAVGGDDRGREADQRARGSCGRSPRRPDRGPP